jgi:subtilisin
MSQKHHWKNRWRVAGLGLMLLLLGSLATSPSLGAAHPAPPAQNATHIVQLAQGADSYAVASDHGAGITRLYSSAISGFAAVIPEGRLNGQRNDPRVVTVEPNATFNIVDPAEPTQVEPGGLGVHAQAIPAGVSRLGALLSAVSNIDGVDDRVAVTVAVLDTGVDGTHPELNVNVERSADCSSGLVCVTGWLSTTTATARTSLEPSGPSTTA